MRLPLHIFMAHKALDISTWIISSFQASNKTAQRGLLYLTISHVNGRRTSASGLGYIHPSLGSTFQKMSITFAVPKVHLPIHQDFCKLRYSFNLLPSMGRMDGEAPERSWAATNAVTNSTKEMGPGSCRDTLDDHFGNYNWRKVTNLCMSHYILFSNPN